MDVRGLVQGPVDHKEAVATADKFYESPVGSGLRASSDRRSLSSSKGDEVPVKVGLLAQRDV